MRRMYSENQLEKLADSRVEALVEGGTLDNAKPIYCHPLTIRYDDGKLILTCLIFNNDATPFTMDTFKQWVDSTANIVSGGILRVMVSGAFLNTDTNKLVIASYFYKINSTGNYGLFGQNTDTSGVGYMQSATFGDLFPVSTALYDGVNKIN